MKRLVKVSALMMVAALVFTGCNCTKKMLRMADTIKAESNPATLALVGNQVPADITVTFPAKAFEKTTTLEIIPVLVSAKGEELAGDIKYIQGEKVKDNFETIKYADGGSISFKVSFPYDERFSICTLELRVSGKCKKQTEFTPITTLPVAKGITAVQKNADFAAMLQKLPDNFKKVNTVTQEANIMYLINSANVRSNQLTSEHVKALESFLAEYGQAENASVGNVQSRGFASPDGPVDFNDQLSKNRSESAQKAVSKKLDKNTKFDISSYGEDWEGFQKLVEASDMKDRELVLQVLKMYSSPVDRDREIHNLSAAFKYLATDILPQLRRTILVGSADIKSKSDQDLVAAAQSDPSQLELEEALYIAPQLGDANQRMAVYQSAADRFGDARAFNNLAVEQARAGKLNEAAASLQTAASKGTQPEITDNIGLLALQMGDTAKAKETLSKSTNPEAKAALAFAEGDYATAAKGLTGFNQAVAHLANNNIPAAKSALASAPADAQTDYLKAVIAAREGDSKGAIANLKSAIAKDPAMKERAKNDAEFLVLADNADFMSL